MTKKELLKANEELADKLRHTTWDYESSEKENEELKEELESTKHKVYKQEGRILREVDELKRRNDELQLRNDILTMTPEQMKELKEIKGLNRREPNWNITNTGEEIRF